jgi:hypothetical protein
MSVAAPGPATRGSVSYKIRAIAVQARAISGSDVMIDNRVAATIPCAIGLISYSLRAGAALSRACDPGSTVGVMSTTVAAVCPATLRSTVPCKSRALAVLDRACASLAKSTRVDSLSVVAVCPVALLTVSYKSRAPTVLNGA